MLPTACVDILRQVPCINEGTWDTQKRRYHWFCYVRINSMFCTQYGLVTWGILFKYQQSFTTNMCHKNYYNVQY